MQYGDNFWVNFPARSGREQAGRRPAIIWQDVVNFVLPTVLVIPLSTQGAALRYSATYLIRPSATNGLLASSVALIFQLGACDVARIDTRMGALDPSDLAQIQQIARQLQNLP